MSSRNIRLSPDERQRALALPNALIESAERIGAGDTVGPQLAAAKQALIDAGFLKIDYFALVDANSLEPLDEVRADMRLIAAATMGTTRLIDNVRVILDTGSETGSPHR